MLACRMLGHRVRFEASGATMRWACARGCGFAGEKEYATPGEARRYAAAFNREDVEDLGRRAPLSLIALRVARRGRDR